MVGLPVHRRAGMIALAACVLGMCFVRSVVAGIGEDSVRTDCLPAVAAFTQAEPAATAAYVEFNGRLYRVEKTFGPAGSMKRYFDDAGGEFTIDELRAHVAAQPPQVIQPTLADRLATAGPDDMLDLLVVLRHQPAGPISRPIWASVQPQIDALSRQIAAHSRAILPTRSMTPSEEAIWQPAALSQPDRDAKRALALQLDDLVRQTRQQIFNDIVAAVAPEQDAFAGVVASLGGVVTARIEIGNALGARLPAAAIAQLAANPSVARIDLDVFGEPELDVQAQSLGLPTGFWGEGIDGGVHDVGVLDTGVQQDHPALSGHTFMSQNGFTTDPDGHGTGMAGILASGDATFRGMAFGCDKIIVAVAGTPTTSMNGMNFIAGTGEPENVNYSFGNGTANSQDYAPIDQFFDGVINTFGYMVSKSTGNGGFGTGAPTITHPAPAYNLLASANMHDMNTVTRTDDRIYATSSRGPTVAGRKKPDITAPGEFSMTTNRFGGFSDLGGTSSASPHTGGGVVLLYDMGTTNVTACKAVLLNTTDAINDNNTSVTGDDFWVLGSLWNRRYGWGYLNLGAAYLHGLDVFVDTVSDTPVDETYRLFVGEMFPNERATLVWTRHVAYDGATYPSQIENFSDLDLFAYRKSDNGVLASSVSSIDNVEQFHVNENAIVVLKVKVDGSFDPDVPGEQFALATQENFAAASGPVLSATLIHPAIAGPGQTFNVTVEVTNSGDLPAHGVLVDLSGIAIESGANPALLGTIPEGQSAQASWTVEADLAPGEYPLTSSIGSVSYGETFTGGGASSYNVTDCLLGDVNLDGSVNGLDVSPFADALLSPESLSPPQFCAADVQINGLIDGDDLPAFVALLIQ